MPVTNLKIEHGDEVKDCPFCGAVARVGESPIELCNTHTAAYWIACDCGAEMHGKSYSTDVASEDIPKRSHTLAKKSAIEAWNRRAP